MTVIKRWTGEVIAEDGNKTVRELCVEKRADLQGADLRRAYLQGADLRGAYLQGADLRRAYLQGADLRRAYLQGADLRGADLRGVYIEFHQFPSIRLLSSIPLGKLSDALMLELLRRDAYAHPYPERFDEWQKTGKCPYQNEEYFWHFDWQAGEHLYIEGPPQMRDSDLILAICKEKKWKIIGGEK